MKSSWCKQHCQQTGHMHNITVSLSSSSSLSHSPPTLSSPSLYFSHSVSLTLTGTQIPKNMNDQSEWSISTSPWNLRWQPTCIHAVFIIKQQLWCTAVSVLMWTVVFQVADVYLYKWFSVLCSDLTLHNDWNSTSRRCEGFLLVDCLTSQQHASIFQVQICFGVGAATLM